MPPLVIGIGNSTRSDDGVGPQVVAVLEVLAPSASYRTVHQLTPELVEEIAEARLVVFVDASVDATTLSVTPINASVANQGSHTTSPGALLHLTQQLYGRGPELALQVAIPASDFGFGEALSPATARWARLAVSEIAAHLASNECHSPR